MAPSANFTLTIEDDQGRRSRIPVELGEISIGRDADNTVRLDEKNVSRHHARVRHTGDGLVVEDLDAYNGVLVNGARIQGTRAISEHDLVRIGDFQLTITKGADASDALTENTQVTAKVKPSHAAAAAGPEPMQLGEGDDHESTVVSPPPLSLVNKPAAPQIPEREEATAIVRLSQRADLEALQDKGSRTITGDKPKLVCVSTTLAGNVYAISKSEVVLGRTADNDLRIDHRSVSRHHCKIVVEGRRCKVIDLGGANGTLVNGEAYAELALKKGDVIELGHVKLRFVPAGETYELTADEQQAVNHAQKSGGGRTFGDDDPPEDTAVGRRPRAAKKPSATIKIAGIMAAVVVLVGVGAWWWVQRNAGSTAGFTPLSIPGSTNNTAHLQLTDANAPRDGHAATENAGDDSDGKKRDAEQLLVRARMALEQKQWSEAGAFAGAVLMRDPGHTEAIAIRTQTDAEQRYQASYDFAAAAVTRQSWQEALDALHSIPSDSSYGPDAARMKHDVVASRVQDVLNQAKEAIAQHALEDAKAKLNDIDAAVPNHAEVAALRHKIAQEEARLRDYEALEVRDDTAATSVAGGSNTAKVEAKARAGVEARAKAEAKAQAKADVKARSEAVVQAKAEAKAKADVDTQAKADADAKRKSMATAAVQEGASRGVGAKSYFTEGIKALTGGQVDTAIDRFNQCVQVDSRFALCYRALGIAYARKGDAPKAARNYRLYLKADPNASDAAQVRQLLQEYDKAP